jgi:hypothetical protein
MKIDAFLCVKELIVSVTPGSPVGLAATTAKAAPSSKRTTSPGLKAGLTWKYSITARATREQAKSENAVVWSHPSGPNTRRLIASRTGL